MQLKEGFFSRCRSRMNLGGLHSEEEGGRRVNVISIKLKKWSRMGLPLLQAVVSRNENKQVTTFPLLLLLHPSAFFTHAHTTSEEDERRQNSM